MHMSIQVNIYVMQGHLGLKGPSGTKRWGESRCTPRSTVGHLDVGTRGEALGTRAPEGKPFWVRCSLQTVQGSFKLCAASVARAAVRFGGAQHNEAHACTHARTNTHMFACAHTHTQTCTHPCTHTHTGTPTLTVATHPHACHRSSSIIIVAIHPLTYAHTCARGYTNTHTQACTQARKGARGQPLPPLAGTLDKPALPLY